MSTPLVVTERHRKKQLSLTARVLRLLLPWIPTIREAVSPENPNVNLTDWADMTLQFVLNGREESQRAAYDYYRDVKRASTGVSDIPVYDDLRTDPNPAQITGSLLATGPAVYRRRLIEGDTETLALQAAQRALMGAGTRHVLDGSRKLIQQAARSDQTARGWVRVTDGDPCHFCAMLATRGFAAMRDEDGLYKTRESALFVQDGSRGSRLPGEKYHDNCACTVMPVFGSDFELPAEAEKWDKLYADSTRGVSGAEKLKAFRRAYEDSRKANDG